MVRITIIVLNITRGLVGVAYIVMKRYQKQNLGNYYNWFAATAGTSASLASDTATGSICPAGWELPTNDYGDLVEDYGLTNTSFNVLKIFGAPMNIIRAGQYRINATFGVGSPMLVCGHP